MFTDQLAFEGAWRRAVASVASLDRPAPIPRELRRLVDRLLAMPALDRRVLVAQAPQMLPYLHALKELLARSHTVRETETPEALRFGWAAVDVAEALTGKPLSSQLRADLRAEAWANLGNVLRILEDFREAERCFDKATTNLEAGTQDPLLASEVLRRKAVLLRYQRRVEESLALSQRAVDLAAHCNQPNAEGRSRIALARAHRECNEPQKALAEYRRATETLDLRSEGQLAFAILHNTILDLSAVGRSEEALAALTWAADLYNLQRDPLFHLRTDWLRGRLYATCGDLRRAAIFLEGVRQEFRERGMVYDTVLATLDLCLVWAKANRPYKVNELSRQLGPLLASPAIPARALSILEDFEDRASHWKVDAQFVEATLQSLGELRD